MAKVILLPAMNYDTENNEIFYDTLILMCSRWN